MIFGTLRLTVLEGLTMWLDGGLLAWLVVVVVVVVVVVLLLSEVGASEKRR